VSRDRVLIERLDAFLARRGTTRDAVVAAIDEPFGTPLLIVAAGSILHGFGNERSDVDIHVVVGRDVSRLPISSYASDVLVDTKYYSGDEVREWIAAIRDEPWPPVDRLDRDRWERHQSQIINGSRFAYGLALGGNDAWRAWLESLREPWLVTRVVRWWEIESIRRETAARWLADAKPLLASVRIYEAVLAALESRVARTGQLHYGPKWLPEKLRLLDDRCGLEALHAAMRTPTHAREARDYCSRCEGILETLRGGDTPRVAAQLWYLPGVRAHELDGRTLLSRWGLRAIEITGRTPPVRSPREPIWQGAADSVPPPPVLPLFVEDMTWLSIVAPAA
jgi:hypothetical protein